MKKQSLTHQIKTVIGNRILISALFLILIIIGLTVYDVSMSINQLRSRVNEEMKPLEDFVISQVIIDNVQSVDLKLQSFNQQNTSFQVDWEPYSTPAFQSIIWQPPFSWAYDYKLGEIAGYQFGYFKVTGSFLSDKALVYDLAIRFMLLVIFALVVLLLLLPLAKKIPQKLFVEPINHFISLIANPEMKRRELKHILPIELQELENKIIKLLEGMKEHEQQKAIIEIGKNAAQVAHDIRSPLAALDTFVTSLYDKIPEQERIMMLTAFRRINNIANDLVSKYKGHDQGSNAPVFVYVAIKDIVSEKDLEYGSKRIKFNLTLDSPSSAFFLTNGDYTEVRRMFSNLINNAVNAMPKGGTIHIHCGVSGNHITLKIKDEGLGISKDRVAELLSTDEQAKAAGIGLGLMHAKEYMQSHDGLFDLDSKTGIGTTITLSFKRKITPQWLVEKIEFDQSKLIIIIDDDASIHDVWTKKFEGHSIKRLDFYTTAEARHALGKDKIDPGLILCDYEFMGDNATGLDFLEEIQKMDCQKYLVTTHVDNQEILNRCEAISLHLIPKHLLPYVSVQPQKSIIGSAKSLDAVFIDDEPYNHEFWQYAAKKNKKRLKCYSGLADFDRESSHISFATPIYIDLNLQDNIRGLDVAKALKDRGFEKLYIATGFIDFDPNDYPWLAGVIDKTPPF